jgi:hypothetical protein
MEVLPINAIHPVYAGEGHPMFPATKNGKYYLRTSNGWVRAMENTKRKGYYVPYTSVAISGNSGKGATEAVAAAAANARNIDPNNLYRGGKRRKTRRIRKSRRNTRK